MTIYEELVLALQEYSDTSGADDGNLDLQAALGTPGFRIQIRGVTEDTGQAYTELDDYGRPKEATGFAQGVLWAVAHVLGIHDADVFHKSIANEIASLTAKGALSGSEVLLIEDPSSSYSKKRITVNQLLGEWLTPVGPITATTYSASYGQLVTMKGPS